MKPRATFDVPMSRCACGASLDAATSMGHVAEPKLGDVTVCIDCGRLYRFDSALRLRPTTLGELEATGDFSGEDVAMIRQAQAQAQARRPKRTNRRERRASRAKGRSAAPPGYERTCRRMVETLITWLRAHPGQTPRFALPPEKIAVLGGLDQVRDVVARDAPARELVDRFIAIGSEIGGPGGVPTVLMLWAAVQAVGLSAETASLEEFGSFQVLSRGSDVDN